MAITIMKPSISPTRKSTSSGIIQVDTGAAEFNKSLANFGATANQAVNSYFTAKAKQELSYQQSINDTTIDNQLQQLQQDILNPQSELANSPQDWEAAYETGANQILENILGPTSNKILKTSIISSWNKNKVKYEKDVVKTSVNRTNTLLKANHLYNLENYAEQLTNVNDLNQFDIIAGNINGTIEQYFLAGFNDKSETPNTFIEKYVGEAVTNRILNSAKDQSMSDFYNAYAEGSFTEGDELTTAMMGLLSDDQKETVLDRALDEKVNKIDKLLKFDEKAEKLLIVKLEKDLYEAEEEADPILKAAAYKQLETDNLGDSTALQLIAASKNNFNYADVDTIDVIIEKAEINKGNYDYAEILALRPTVTEATFKDLHDTHVSVTSISSPLVNRLRNNIKGQIFSTNNAYIESMQENDPNRADAYNDATSIYVKRFDDLVMEGKLSPIEIFNQVMTEADGFVRTKLLTSAQNVINELNELNIMEQNNVSIDVNNITQSKLNIKNSQIAEIRQKSIIEQIDMLKTTYGADIYNRLANQ